MAGLEAATVMGATRGADEAAPFRRSAMAAVLTVDLGALTVLMIVRGAADAHGSGYWLGVGSGLVLYAVAFAAVILPPANRFGTAAAALAMTAAAAGCLSAWAAAAVDGGAAIDDYDPMFVTVNLIATILVFRSHAVLAWIGAAGALAGGFAIAPVAVADWWSTMQTVTLLMLVAATAASVAFSPLLGEMDALAVRRGRLAGETVDGGDQQTRQERIVRIDARVRPLLESLLAQGQVSTGDVVTARLIEAQLRDGIRAPAFDTDFIREAVWSARTRGVSVTLLDDGALREFEPAAAERFLTAVLPLLYTELAALPRGELVARVSPPGRSPIASVTSTSGSGRRRIEIAADGVITKVVHS